MWVVGFGVGRCVQGRGGGAAAVGFCGSDHTAAARAPFDKGAARRGRGGGKGGLRRGFCRGGSCWGPARGRRRRRLLLGSGPLPATPPSGCTFAFPLAVGNTNRTTWAAGTALSPCPFPRLLLLIRQASNLPHSPLSPLPETTHTLYGSSHISGVRGFMPSQEYTPSTASQNLPHDVIDTAPPREWICFVFFLGGGLGLGLLGL